jgi:acetylornithine/N-succinyldiaminopimelate aminotransferase
MSLITTYNPMPVSFTHGKGVWLFDKQNNAYLDSFSGIAVCGLGHAHPEVTTTIQQQAARLIHTSNGVQIEEQHQLAEKLVQISGLQQVFFANSGAEVNEAAIKISRLFGHKKQIEKPSLIVMESAFHGRTMATLSASGSRKVQAGFEPLVPGFVRAPFNDSEAISTIAANREDIVGIMLEPIQGEGGVVVADEQYLRKIQKICQEKDWLLILDEIQTGNGRTGHYFSYMEYNLRPDLVTTAKGLGNGFPIGACLIGERAIDLLKPGNHGSTFGGSPLACATALTVVEVIERDGLCKKALQNGLLLKEKLLEALGEHFLVKTIRGKGLMLGIELNHSANDLKLIALKNNLLLNVTSETVIRLLPALIISEEEIEEMVGRLVKSINEWASNLKP